LSDLTASSSKWEGIIIEQMLKSLSKNKKITIYTKDENLRKLAKHNSDIQINSDCTKADFILADTKESCHKPTIVFDYYKYRKTPEAVGVFFWQKGRPTIRFSKKRLNNFGLKVTGELSKFVSTR
jgi:hypothetical protein